ncbi:hypothetical protein QTP70_010534 [Hemibagrus guttatus]|uniref:Uncharacterized protein n=1 Tax=Hemibagrus guttatus TaxID=175788 RepID=A0AAE0R4K1_9TELE|nr:hypothetical protein QTP70_010534 [Hemibagrus guttatus]
MVGHENIVSASRMNSAIVVFLNDVEKVRGHLAWACPVRQSDPGVSERPGQDAAKPAGVVPPAAAVRPAAAGPGAAAAPDLTE